MANAVFLIPSAPLLHGAVAIIEDIFKEMEREARQKGHLFQDIQGNVYERLLSEIGTAGKNGQFRTPRHIIKLVSELVKPKLGDSICDPACGTAGFLLDAWQYVTRLPSLRQRPWRLAILDEAQAIKNPAARQTRAVKELRADARVALTGTPVENRLGDLWSLFDFINPGLLDGAAEFGRLVKTLSADPARQFAPLRQLTGPYILRRLKTDKRIIADLPDKTEVTAWCALSKARAALYEQAVREMAQKLADVDDESVERRGLVLAFLMRFKQICNHPSQWLHDGGYDPQESGKFLRLRELAEPIAARQEKALVFTQFREMTAPLADYLAQLFGRPGLVLHGYGVGAWLDEHPELLFTLREVDHLELIASAADAVTEDLAAPVAGETNPLDDRRLTEIFGIEIDGGTTPAAVPKPTRRTGKTAAGPKPPTRKPKASAIPVPGRNRPAGKTGKPRRPSC